MDKVDSVMCECEVCVLCAIVWVLIWEYLCLWIFDSINTAGNIPFLSNLLASWKLWWADDAGSEWSPSKGSKNHRHQNHRHQRHYQNHADRPSRWTNRQMDIHKKTGLSIADDNDHIGCWREYVDVLRTKYIENHRFFSWI